MVYTFMEPFLMEKAGKNPTSNDELEEAKNWKMRIKMGTALRWHRKKETFNWICAIEMLGL